MKKRFFGLFLGASMVLSMLAGCGNSGSETTASTGAAESETQAASEAAGETATGASEAIEDTAQSVADAVEETLGTANGEGKLVGITVPSIGNDFALAVTNAMQEAVTATGATVQFDSAEVDVTTQISQIENDVTMGCDILVVWAVNGDGVASAVEQAVNQGIPVLAFANEIPTASCSMISASDADMGTACGEIALDWLDQTFPDAGDGEIKVLAITASTYPEAGWRSDAIVAKVSEDSRVNLIEAEVADWNDQAAARTMVENQLLANPDVKMIVTCNGTTALGAESFVMSSASNIEDKANFGIFTVDQTDEIDSKIQASVNNESVLRGTISMGTIDDTVGDFMKAMTPLLNDQEPVDVNGSAFKVTPESFN
ncbi:ABC-type sugar transport system substrate-binding protein [Catenibacillus scindens]|uniref:ABC-type sugar transport system substrate-binding protein n=1 Tax=Catenibacillus scindens TaxID=673271 RepID=A0A7W8H8U9_9FIRM|nr:sugar ABC transporter substrate-binding protein [Catenibacillus scindens]MBB5263285.1 ABC-type sugar transport system substrate-binding protein [Catenibacillus scindens]